MFVRIRAFCLAAICLAAFTSGCKKSSPEQPAEHRSDQPIPEPAGQAEIIGRIHWLGMKQIAAESNAASFMSVWNLPESQKLEAQTLDKFALAPWGLPREGTNTAAIVATNAASRLLRPLLDDLVQQESYLEVAGSTNQPGEATLAIHLDSQRSALWQTNLASALESLTGSHVTPSANSNGGWRLETAYRLAQPTNEQTTATNYINLERVQDWTLIAFGPAQNALLTKFASTVYKRGIPFTPRMTNFWIEADLNLPRIFSTFSISPAQPNDFPNIALTMIGHGADIRTVADLIFSKPLDLDLKPWNVPTNLIHGPLASFTAIQGFDHLLPALKLWQDTGLGNPPNDLYFWTQGAQFLLSFWAAPLTDASNRVSALTERLLQQGNQWLDTNGIGKFVRATNMTGVLWDDLPFLVPYLRSITQDGSDFIMGGLGPAPLASKPLPEGLLAQFQNRTNVVCYDWELTGKRLDAAQYIAQFFRFVLLKAQVPPQSTSLAWFEVIPPKLSNCGTIVTLEQPNHLSFVRNSTIGLSSTELQWLADWLESSQFPLGLNTFTGTPTPTPRRPKQKTNSALSQPNPGPSPATAPKQE